MLLIAGKVIVVIQEHESDCVDLSADVLNSLMERERVCVCVSECLCFILVCCVL